MPILQIRHTTTYRYSAPVEFGEHRMMLRPRESFDQRVISARLTISPDPAELRFIHDVFGNGVAVANFTTPADTLTFESEIVVDHDPAPLLAEPGETFGLYAGATFPFAYDGEDLPDLLRSIERDAPDPGRAVDRWAQGFLRGAEATPVLSLLAEMTRAIHAGFTYGRRLEAGVQSPAQTLASRSGTCRDFAVLMIDACRSLGLAARFVSGYIHCPPKGGRGEHAGGGHTHAWVQVYHPSCGWVEFDPTNGIVGARDLIRVAVVRDPRQAIPLSGTWDGPAEAYLGMEVEVSITAETQRARRRGAA